MDGILNRVCEILHLCPSYAVPFIGLYGYMQTKSPTYRHKLVQVDNAPDPEEFFKMYVSRKKPAVFRSAVTQSPASRLWSDEYISKNFGDMEVRLEAKNEKVSDNVMMVYFSHLMWFDSVYKSYYCWLLLPL